MNNTKLQVTHKHLTLVFTGVVFLIVIILAGTFLGAKYYNENRHERKEFLSQVQSIMMKANSDISILQKIQRVRQGDEKKQFGDRRQGGDTPKIIPISFFILDENRNIIFESIMREPEFHTLRFETQRYYTDADTYIALRELGENTVVFYQDIYYDLGDMISDFLLLLVLASISGVLFYFIGYRFVEKALKPVQQNLQDMTDFVHNAGHELKTPLAVMRGNLQVMQVEEKYDKKLIKKSIREVDNTNSLIEGLIELSQVGKLSDRSALALAIEVRKAVNELGNLAIDKKITLNNSVNGSFIVYTNGQELHILLMNIIKNAITYSKKGGEVNITLHKNTLSIVDNGIGISSKDQEKIFERFYQGSTSRSGEGFGIGLSLVKKIVDANNWKIEVRSEQGKGSEFKIIF